MHPYLVETSDADIESVHQAIYRGHNPNKGEMMPTVVSIMAELKKKGSEKTRRMYARHGMATKNMFGVSIADLKIIQKTIKGTAVACLRTL